MAKKKQSVRKVKRLAGDIVEARVFRLIDEDGRERACLSCDTSITLIQLFDGGGVPAVQLQVGQSGTSIRIANHDHSTGISLVVTGHGNGLGIHGTGKDASGQSISIGIPGPESNDPRGRQPDITIIDEDNRRIWSAFDGTYPLREKGKGKV